MIVGIFPFPPFIEIAPDDTPDGYMIELANAVADEAGLEVEYRRFDGLRPFFDAQISGETHLMAAVATLPALQGSNSFSEPIATARVRIAVRAEDATEMAGEPIRGKRIGHVPPIIGSSERDLLDANTAVAFDSVEAALLALLSGDVNALLIAEVSAYSTARSARLENRIAFVGQPVRTFDRVISIHHARSDVQARVFEAVTRLQASGRLQALREKYFLDLPPPPPEVLSVGVLNFPPFTVVNQDGTFSGHSTESLRELAKRAGLKLRFEEIQIEQWRAGPAPGRYDLLPQAGINDDRRARMDFTIPVSQAPLSIFLRAEEAEGVTGLDDLAGLKVGVQRANLAYRLVQDRADFELVFAPEPDDLLEMLLSGQADAILYPTSQVLRTAEDTGVRDRIHVVEPPFFVTERAPALRFGLGEVRERLNAVIPGFLISEEAAALNRKWFGDPRQAELDRIRMFVLWSSFFVILILLIAIGTIIWRRQSAERDRMRYASEMVDQIPLGLLLISPKGTIEFANDEMKSRTPGGEKVLVVGANYRKAIQSLIGHGVIDPGERTRQEMLDHMTSTGLEDGVAEEHHLTNGGTFIRMSRHLSDGSILLMRMDVTDERRRLAEISDLNQRLTRQITLADAANEELRSFAYSTSHDLKAPTNTMKMLIDVLGEQLKGRVSEDDLVLLQDLDETATRMAQLIVDVLDYTNAIGSDPIFEEVDLELVLDDVMRALRADIDAADARIERLPLPTLMANASQMRQLLQNLIGNAIKFRSPDRAPEVVIDTVQARAGKVTLRVTDNGIGIPSEHRARVFRIFSRLHGHERFPGTGMGLAICQRIARNHGGEIRIDDAPDGGTRFTVTVQSQLPMPGVGSVEKPTAA